MLSKQGVNSIKVEKRVSQPKDQIKVAGPSAPIEGGSSKVVICSSCKKKFKKTCPSEYACNVLTIKCPNCGNIL